jgi:hypothetical protein
MGNTQDTYTGLVLNLGLENGYPDGFMQFLHANTRTVSEITCLAAFFYHLSS